MEEFFNDAPWMREGLCRQIDPELWLSVKLSDQRQAQMICFTCPVQEKCLDYALERNERWGIWGGLTERQRRRYRMGLPVDRRMRAQKG